MGSKKPVYTVGINPDAAASGLAVCPSHIAVMLLPLSINLCIATRLWPTSEIPKVQHVLLWQLHGISLTLPILSTYLFKPGYILPCQRPKHLNSLTNKSNTHMEGHPTSVESEVQNMRLYSNLPMHSRAHTVLLTFLSTW